MIFMTLENIGNYDQYYEFEYRTLAIYNRSLVITTLV